MIELEPGRKRRGRHVPVVRADDWWFPGHFPERPVMPGVLIVEAMAQTGAVAVLVEEENRGKIAFFAGIDDCRFKRVVSPGETLLRSRARSTRCAARSAVARRPRTSVPSWRRAAR